MMLQGKHWTMIAGAVALVGLLALAPRTPEKPAEGEAAQGSARVSEDPNSGSTPHAQGATEGPMAQSSDEKVNAILAELNNGAPPMQTIMKLRELADKEPNNVEAQYHLGLFSWQTGQQDKAIGRFKRVTELSPTGYPDAYAYLAQAYAALDSTEKAITAITVYKTLVTDTAQLNGADRFLSELRTKSTLK
jgi:predicted Zn-dependent protease